MTTPLETKFTSTAAKLLKQYARFPEWERGILRPISLQLAPTDKCNLNCEFCSVKFREGDEMDINDVEEAVMALVARGLKTAEVTGGGDPTCYGEIEHLIGFLSAQGLQVGLITNGLSLKKTVSRKILDMLTWLRVSMNSLDYVDEIELPELSPETTLGFSYVVNLRMKPGTIAKILDYMDACGVEYLRVVPNCLDTNLIAWSRQTAENMGLLDHERVFYQSKEYDVPAQCRVGYIKPFLAPDGYFYHCSANPLILRKFNPVFRMGQWMEVERIWQLGEPCAPFDTTNCQQGKCFFKEHNEFLDAVELPLEHRNFV